MTKRFTQGLFDRLLDAQDAGAGWSLEQIKDGVARDLEDLLNTRTAISPELMAKYPAVRRSLVNYGLRDFSAMCLSNEVDRKAICAEVKSVIEHHEPRLYGVSADLRTRPGAQRRIDFVITAMLRTSSRIEPVSFDAVLQASSHRYAVSKTGADGA